MASWAAVNSRLNPTAWLTLDEYDNGPRVFWPYVVEALRQVGVGVNRPVSAAARSGPADLRFILQLAAAIGAQGSPVTLVLDDLHLVTRHSHMAGLARLLRNARPSLRLVVASRGDPGFPLHRYRLAGEITEIRADELAFTVQEARLLMAQHGVTLPSHALEFLTERAEGWAAALRLAAISMNGNPDPEQAVKEIVAGDGAAAGYLVEEVLSSQPRRVRNLLLKTSILERVSADIAKEVAEDDQAPSELPALAEANAFVQPLRRGWYRYHSLFAEVLRLKLCRESPEEVPRLRRRAARWFRQNGALAEAARQGAEAGDWQLAARIVIDELAVSQLIQSGAINPLVEVLRGMPAGQDWPEPQPWLVMAALALQGETGDAASLALSTAEGLLQKLPPAEETPSRLAAALTKLALSRRTGDFSAAKTAAEDALLWVGKIPPELLARHPEVRGQVMAGRGFVEFWSGGFGQAATTFRASATSGGAYQHAKCLGYLALLEAVNGQLTSSAALAAEAADLSQDGQNLSEHASRAASIASAYVHLQRYELQEARRHLKKADAALQACPDKLIGAVASLVAARGCLAEGRPREACQIVARAQHGWPPPPWLERSLDLVESRARVAMGDTEAALDAAERAGGRTSLESAAMLARSRLAVGDERAAKQTLAAASATFGHSPDHARVEARLVEAHIAQLTGDRQHVVRSLEHAFKLAEPEHLRLPFILERDWLRTVVERDPSLMQACRDLLESPRPMPESGRARAADAAKAPLTSAPVAASNDTAPLVVDKLSEREVEVLHHVSEMLATAEIATEMYVSVNTVKSHLKSIFRKLGAASRNEAVRRARQLELM